MEPLGGKAKGRLVLCSEGTGPGLIRFHNTSFSKKTNKKRNSTQKKQRKEVRESLVVFSFPDAFQRAKLSDKSVFLFVMICFIGRAFETFTAMSENREIQGRLCFD